jgi:hypothetical protein
MNERNSTTPTFEKLKRHTKRGAVAGAAVAAVVLLPGCSNAGAERAHVQIVVEQSAESVRAVEAAQFKAGIIDIIEEIKFTDENLIGFTEIGQGGSATEAIDELIPADSELSKNQGAATLISAEFIDDFYNRLNGGAIQPTDAIGVVRVNFNGQELFIGAPVVE